MPPVATPHAARLVDPAAIWRHACGDVCGLGMARAYLSAARGFADTSISRIEGRFGGIDVDVLDSSVGLPDVTRWQIAEGGGALAVPLITLNGGVANVAFRLTRTHSKAPKCVTLPDLPVGSRYTPIGFGDMHELVSAPLVVVVEGVMDTLTTKTILGGSVAVIGAHSASHLSLSWPWWMPAVLGHHTEIVVVPHVDPSGLGEKCAVDLTASLIARGKRARLFRWGACLELLGVPETVLRTSITDLTDLVPIALPDRVSAAVRRGLGVAP